jgi:integrase/recombinase XerD
VKKDLSQLFNEFLFESEYLRKVRPETLRAYKSIFASFIKLSPEASLESLYPATILEFFKTLQERKRIVGKGLVKSGVKKSTIATYWSKLNCFFGWLKQKGFILKNPFDDLPYPTPSYDDRKYLKREDIDRILNAIHLHHDGQLLMLKRNLVIFYLLLYCGLRREELLLLQIRDIDLERRVVTIREEISKSTNTRQIPLHSTLVMHLKDYLSNRRYFTTPYLIISTKKDIPLTVNGLKHLVDKLRAKSGVCFHLHQFRHTFAVNFLKSSNNIVKLKQLLGHKSIVMTMTYLRCLPISELRADIENMKMDYFI